MFDALEKLRLPTKVVSGPRALAGLTPPSNVEILEGITPDEIHVMMQQARVNVIPMNLGGIVAGTVTIAQTLRLGRAPVITNRIGIHDYVRHEETGLLVEPFDVGDMGGALERMWEDHDLRNRLNTNASDFAMRNCTDEAAGASLRTLLDRLTAEYRAQS